MTMTFQIITNDNPDDDIDDDNDIEFVYNSSRQGSKTT